MRTKLLILGAFALVAALVLPALVPAAGEGVRKLEAVLDGGAEVPDKGDEDGTGLAKVTIKDAKGKVCFDITFEDTQPPFAGHIHKGKGNDLDPGPIDVPLFEGSKPLESPIKGCVDAKSKILGKIKKNPPNYYVNLHNEAYPGGAIRGQLEDR